MKGLIEKRIAQLEFYFDYKGINSYDPYDGLNTPFRVFLFKNKISERILQQVIRLAPINFRPILGIRKQTHTKTVSDLLSANCILYRKTDEEKFLNKADLYFKILKSLSLQSNNGIGWGLNFYFTTRFVQADKSTPNLFQTINAVHSLIDYYEVKPDEHTKILVEEGVNFILKDLGYNETKDFLIWSYWKDLESPIYNVNGLMIGLLARAEKIMNIDNSEYLIKKTLEFLKQGQNTEGSWYYSADDKANFIDGFHTGYILEGLCIAKLNEVDIDGEMFSNGINYYLQNLFQKNKLPKYYNNSAYPIDAQNCAQALQTLYYLKKLGLVEQNYIEKVFSKIDTALWNEKGYYNYMKTKMQTYTVSMNRWANSPMYLALAYNL